MKDINKIFRAFKEYGDLDKFWNAIMATIVDFEKNYNFSKKIVPKMGDFINECNNFCTALDDFGNEIPEINVGELFVDFIVGILSDIDAKPRTIKVASNPPYPTIIAKIPEGYKDRYGIMRITIEQDPDDDLCSEGLHSIFFNFVIFFKEYKFSESISANLEDIDVDRYNWNCPFRNDKDIQFAIHKHLIRLSDALQNLSVKSIKTSVMERSEDYNGEECSRHLGGECDNCDLHLCTYCSCYRCKHVSDVCMKNRNECSFMK